MLLVFAFSETDCLFAVNTHEHPISNRLMMFLPLATVECGRMQILKRNLFLNGSFKKFGMYIT